MRDVDLCIQQLKNYLNTNAFFVESHHIAETYDADVDRFNVFINLKCINLQNNESDLVKLLRVIRSKIPNAYKTKITITTSM